MYNCKKKAELNASAFDRLLTFNDQIPLILLLVDKDYTKGSLRHALYKGNTEDGHSWQALGMAHNLTVSELNAFLRQALDAVPSNVYASIFDVRESDLVGYDEGSDVLNKVILYVDLSSIAGLIVDDLAALQSLLVRSSRLWA